MSQQIIVSDHDMILELNYVINVSIDQTTIYSQ